MRGDRDQLGRTADAGRTLHFQRVRARLQPHVRGVYNDALIDKRVDWSRSRGQYDGPLTRAALMAALHEQQARFLATLDAVDPEVRLDWGRAYYTFPTFTWEFVQHEAIHHGQWSLYAFLAQFETPDSWRTSWKL